LRVEGNGIGFPEVSFPGFLDHVVSQPGFETIQAGFGFVLLLKEARAFGGTDGSISGRMDLGSKSFVFFGRAVSL